MDWLKSILQILPLETISDILGELVIWWSQLVKDVPPADLPMYAYLGGAIMVLVLWVLVARVLPRPLGGMSWMILFAVLLAPGTALGDPSVLAPASISVVYAIMMKDTAAAVTNALPILIVLVVGLFIGFVWQLIRGVFESSLDKARRRTAEDTQANMQLATGNYLEKIPEQPLPTGVSETDISLKKERELQREPVIEDAVIEDAVIEEPVIEEPAIKEVATNKEDVNAPVVKAVVGKEPAVKTPAVTLDNEVRNKKS